MARRAKVNGVTINIISVQGLAGCCVKHEEEPSATVLQRSFSGTTLPHSDWSSACSHAPSVILEMSYGIKADVVSAENNLDHGFEWSKSGENPRSEVSWDFFELIGITMVVGLVATGGIEPPTLGL